MFDPDRLSQIDTLWTVVRRAHNDGASQVAQAQQTLLERYGPAAQRYLRAVVKDRDGADEVYQDFAVKFLRGDFASVSPERGRFRAFLKTVLFRMAMDFHRRGQRGPIVREMDSEFDPIGDEGSAEYHEQFVVSWREELLAKAWVALKQLEAETGKPMHTVLLTRVEQPDAHSPELAAVVSQQLGREITPENIRVMLHRAREKFGELLLDEVVQSLDRPTLDDLEEELGDLRLLEYCQPALAKRT
jgi:RNA polymerase sigma-70 factor (ECF subfamily)